MGRDTFLSGIFGVCQEPHEDELEKLIELIEEFPVAAFQVLNRNLNQRGLRIQIDVAE